MGREAYAEVLAFQASIGPLSVSFCSALAQQMRTMLSTPGRQLLHLQEDGAGFAVAADGGPVEGGAALPIPRCDLRVQHDEQAHAVRKALVGRPVQRCPSIYVRTAEQSCHQVSVVRQMSATLFERPS